jgi:hypothetical protein
MRSVSIVISSRLHPAQLPLSIAIGRCVNHHPPPITATTATAETAEIAEKNLIVFLSVLRGVCG